MVYDNAWPGIWDQGCKRPVLKCHSLFVLEAGLTMEKRTDLTEGLLRPRLSRHSPAWPVVRNKPSHDCQHTNYTDSCLSDFSSAPPTTPGQLHVATQGPRFLTSCYFTTFWGSAIIRKGETGLSFMSGQREPR